MVYHITKKKNVIKNNQKITRLKTDAQMKKILKNINILILGPGWPLNELKKRKNIKNELRTRGFSAHIMEEKPQLQRQITHVDKFDELLQMPNLLCVAISTPKGYSVGLSFEIGYICGLFGRSVHGRKKLEKELGFIVSDKANIKEILSSYITTGLFHDGIFMQYEYANTNQIISHIETMVKIRAQKLGWF